MGEPRRHRGEGSITQIRQKGVDGAKADKWQGRVTISPGVRRSVYAPTREECLAAMSALKEAGLNGNRQTAAQEEQHPRFARLQTSLDGRVWQTVWVETLQHEGAKIDGE